MIARSWHGRVPTAKAEEYFTYLERTGLRDYRSTPGNRAVWVLRRTDGPVTDYLLVTWWDSIEAIERFAGDRPLTARYYPEDDRYLLEREPFVTHYDVLLPRSPAMTETERIADQLVHAFEGDPWVGRSIRDQVGDWSPERAARRLIPGGHSVWEILGHVAVWLRIARTRLGGQAAVPTDAENFPPAPDRPSAEAWRALWAEVEREYRALADAIRRFPDDRLGETVPGKSYDVYYLLHGVIQHSLYHGGQLAILTHVP